MKYQKHFKFEFATPLQNYFRVNMCKKKINKKEQKKHFFILNFMI